MRLGGFQSVPDHVFVCSDQVVVLAGGLSVGLLSLLLLALMVYCLWRKRKGPSPYEELPPTGPSVPACPAPVILVSQSSWTTLVPQHCSC